MNSGSNTGGVFWKGRVGSKQNAAQKSGDGKYK